MTRRERLEAKLDRRQEWAEKAAGRAAARFDAVHRLADQIPLEAAGFQWGAGSWCGRRDALPAGLEG